MLEDLSLAKREAENISKQVASLCGSLATIESCLDLCKNNINKFNCLTSNCFEIGRIEALLEEEGHIVVKDEWELTIFCINLAKKFSAQYDPETGDYPISLDKFVTDALLKEYGVNKLKPMKDGDVYFEHMHEVCYIPKHAESSADCYTHSMLLALVQGDEELCEEMFNELEDENPQDFVETQLINGYWTKCEACGRIFNTDYSKDPTVEIDECPNCHTLLPGDEDPLKVCMEAIARGE